jgi:hypothetical protein
MTQRRPSGDTQRNIFRLILRYGGSVEEPKIRKFLMNELELINQSNVMKHINIMINNKLIIKKRLPGSFNIMILAINNDECIKYLKELIYDANKDPTIFNDLLPFIEENDTDLDKLKAAGTKYNVVTNDIVLKIEKSISLSTYSDPFKSQ